MSKRTIINYRGFEIRRGNVLGEDDFEAYFVYNDEGFQMFDYHEDIPEAQEAIDEYLGY